MSHIFKQKRAGSGSGARAALLLSTVALAGVLGIGAASAGEVFADVVYKNGKIYTMDTDSSVVSGVAVMNGRFIAVGTDAEVGTFVGPDTKVVDLEQQPVVPGLNDTHVHTLDAGEAATQVPLEDVTTVAEALERIKAFAATKKPGEWIIGGSWHPTSQLKEQRYLTAAEIDSVAPDNPVQLPGHVSSFNTAAMKLAGIDKNTPDPEGGIIQRDANGEPTGIFEEKASSLIRKFIPEATVEEMETQYLTAMKVANSYGLTSATDPGLTPGKLRALQRLYLDGKLTLRYSTMYAATGATPEQWEASTNGIGASSGFGNEWLKLDAIGEMSIDGGMTFRTAYMREPYPDDPEYRGVPAMFKERLMSNVSIGNKNDWRFSIHEVGDAAVDWVLDAYEAADAEKSIMGRRFAVMHGSMIQRDQLERMKKLGVIFELQNIFMWDKAANVERNLGRKNADRAVPTRMAIDVLGINNVSLGSDFSTNTMNPWIGMYVAITRKDPNGTVYGADQAITREEALHLYTVSGAYTSFEEDIKGPIEVGKLADMVVLDRDFFTVPEDQIKDIQAVETIVGGNVVYQR
jgi:predicted amidohydrolase YtcJ